VRTIHVFRSARNYFIDGIYWGDDEEGVMMYLRAKGVAPDEIAQALAGVAQAGAYIIQQEDYADLRARV
jgi:hypothetical protein